MMETDWTDYKGNEIMLLDWFQSLTGNLYLEILGHK